MRLATKLLTAGLITLSAGVSAHQHQKFIDTDYSVMTEVCMAVASNKPMQLSATLKNNRLTKDKAKKSIRCNDLTLVQFAEKHHAVKTIAYLQKG